ncbi:MAG: HAMP domain-containing histidine kinase, partial [Marinilabiliales bacterium]|nr:HAMP domain-containing histidine kinase [Marinilabiliales bacterium]
ARMQRGMIQFAPVPIRLAPFVAEIVAENQPKAEGKSIHIQLSIPEDLCIVGDEHMLLSVIGNLLTNAIKFTPRGGSIGVSAQPARDGKVEMIIWDNGIGMDETMLAGLFRIDAHNCRPGTEGEPSVGLGLILCKEFVIKQEGEIRVESSPGKGTTFHILLRMLP